MMPRARRGAWRLAPQKSGAPGDRGSALRTGTLADPALAHLCGERAVPTPGDPQAPCDSPCCRCAWSSLFERNRHAPDVDEPEVVFP